MCRHLAYVGAPRSLAELLLAGPGCLYEQSWAPRAQRHGTVNADGFGIGWYGTGADTGRGSGTRTGTGTGSPAPEPPARYRRAVPIWADPNLPDLARTIRSGAVLAAVRSATPGTSQDESAAAPYRWGRWLFSHNGAVPDWEKLITDTGVPLPPEALLCAEARCDAAVLWAMITQRLDAGEPPGGALAAVVRCAAAVRPRARLNLLLTDGRTIAATRYGDTLWYRADEGGVRVASEPVSADGGWQEVPEHSLLLATRDAVRTVPLKSTGAAPRPAPRPEKATRTGNPAEGIPLA